MPKLPTARQIPGLTSGAIKAVALCYLGQLQRGKEYPEAIEFSKAAIEHYNLRTTFYQDERNHYVTAVNQLLNFVPHCRVTPQKDLLIVTHPSFLDWCDFSEVKFELIHVESDSVYVFENEEDRILFKLRWL